MLPARRRAPPKAGRWPRTRTKIDFHDGIVHLPAAPSYLDPRKVDLDTATSTAR